jgi:hypothetical protein
MLESINKRFPFIDYLILEEPAMLVDELSIIEDLQRIFKDLVMTML